MGPDGRLCRSYYVPQDGGSVGAAKTANSRRHLVPNIGPRHHTVFDASNPAMKEDDPG